MNGVENNYSWRKGYLLTALAAAVLLAASSGTAYAQRVSIGFVGTSGAVSETAFLDANSLTGPLTVTVRVSGLLPGVASTWETLLGCLGAITITPNKDEVFLSRRVTSSGYIGTDTATAEDAEPMLPLPLLSWSHSTPRS